MKVIRNTFFLYLSFFLSSILGLLQLKILSLYIPPQELGKFFTLSAFGQLVSGIFVIGIPYVLIRYLPKFHSIGDKNKLASLFFFTSSCYFIITLVVYILFAAFGYKLGALIYKDATIGAYFSFSYIVFSMVTYFTLIFTAFNGFRKMHYSAGLNLLYLLVLTIMIIVMRDYLSPKLLLEIYLFSALTAIIIGLALLFREFKCVPLFTPLSSLKEIFPYWRYAIFLGLLVPIACYLDKLIIGYFLGMQFVAMFAIADKINSYARRLLDIPLEAVSPEISYFWERGEKGLLGQKLELLIKLLFVLSVIFVIIILAGGKLILRTLATQAYFDAFSVLCFFGISIVLSALYSPVVTAMRATGKIVFHVVSAVIWICVYLVFILIFIQKFKIAGVGAAYLMATFCTLVFNIGWVSRQHTSLKFNPIFFYKVIGAGVIIGLAAFFAFRIPCFDHKIELALLGFFVFAGYGIFLLNPTFFSPLEKQQIKYLFKNFLS